MYVSLYIYIPDLDRSRLAYKWSIMDLSQLIGPPLHIPELLLPDGSGGTQYKDNNRDDIIDIYIGMICLTSGCTELFV